MGRKAGQDPKPESDQQHRKVRGREEKNTWIVPKYDPDGQELPSWDHIWDFTGGPIRLVRTYRGTTEPSWAHEGDVRFLGEYPADLAAVRKMVARFFRTDRLPESALAAKLSQP